jgi:hypothetical protein
MLNEMRKYELNDMPNGIPMELFGRAELEIASAAIVYFMRKNGAVGPFPIEKLDPYLNEFTQGNPLLNISALMGTKELANMEMISAKDGYLIPSEVFLEKLANYKKK